MKRPSMLASAAVGAALLPSAALAGLRAPYVADAQTVHLWHFEEAGGGSSTANAGTAGGNAFTLDGNPLPPVLLTNVLGAAGYSGFGTAADLSGGTDRMIGYDGNNNGAYNHDADGSNPSADAISLSTLGIGDSNPFTLEALVFPGSATGNRQIISTDSSAASRGFQFRLTTGGTTGQRLEFNLIGVAGAQRFAEIPATGANAFALNQWFHAAFVFDGTDARFYWTRVDPAVVEANLVGGNQALTISGGGTIQGPLVFGNENRAAAGEGINGRIDQVRISSTGRSGSEFIFFNNDTDGDGLDDNWELQYFQNLNQTASGDPDGDGFTNLQEFQAGSDPTNPASTPLDLDADGLPDAWEMEVFGNLGQTGAGDPDADFATNAQEHAASTSPLDRNSFPDADNDGMPDGWEAFYFPPPAANPEPFADADGDGFANIDEFLMNSHPRDAAWTPEKSKLRHRWTFNNTLQDSIGGSHATIVDPDNDPATGGGATLGENAVTLGGGARDTSSYVLLGNNLLQGLRTPVSIELWATQNSVQNWSRIFDFGSSTSEYLFMSWTQGTNIATDQVSWADTVTSTASNTNQPYTLGTEFHIVMTIQPGMGANGGTLVSWYRSAVTNPDLGSARGTFTTGNSLMQLNDALNLLGRSQWPDATANARYNEVRIWNGALAFEQREFLHDVGPNVIDLNDTDGDGLPDEWEMEYLETLSYGAEDDPDGDFYTNMQEFLDGTDPSNIFSSYDADFDGLPDGWEVHWFRDGEDNLFDIIDKFSGADDPDGDGFSNLPEFQAGSDPTDPLSTPLDLDKDGLPDGWEMFRFGNLGQTAGGDPDSDGFSNLQEAMAGSNPTDPASTPSDADGNGVPDANNVLKPYTVDAATLHLWHLDEILPPANDAVSGGTTMTSLANGAYLWAPSVPGFGTALNVSTNRGTSASGLLSALPLVDGAGDDTTLVYMGEDGAFTFEAVVRLDFDPAAVQPTAQLSAPMQIVSGDGDAANRVWQFRIVPRGTQNTGSAPTLEFININGETNIQTLGAPLPLGVDPDAAQQGNWYHVAVAYNGQEATAENFRLFWTRLDSSRTQARQLAAAQMNLDLMNGTPDFVIGNEGRAIGGSTDNFPGVIDEVRISSIARNASQFLFQGAGGGDSDGDGLPDDWEMTHFGNLNQTAAGDFDGDGTSNRAEYLLGLNPANGSSRFAATRSGNTLTWNSAAGLSFTVQRSTTLAVDSWTNLATVTGEAGQTSYTDPAPPAGRAFYRVLLTTP